MIDAQRNQKLHEKLKPFAHPEARSDAYLVVRQWIEQALSRQLDGWGERSFAPFNGYFQNPRELRQSFAKMVEVEFAGVELGQINAERVLARAIVGALDATLQKEGRPMLDERRIAPRVFDLLQFLFDLEPDEAYRWAARAVRDRNGFAELRSANGTPAPIALYFASPATQFAAGECADIFEQAVFDWCVSNSHEPGAVKICLSLLPRILSSLSVGTPIEAVGRQTDVFVQMSNAFTKDGEALASALDALAWRNARVAAGDPLDSTVGVETQENFVKVAEDIASSFAPGLRESLRNLGLSNINDLIAISASAHVTYPTTAEQPSPQHSFGGGGMLEALLVPDVGHGEEAATDVR
jgi:hypothetical protein